MKVRTWEKWYWGIIIGFITLSVIGIYQKEGDKIEIKTQIGDKVDRTYWSKGKAALIVTIFYLIVFLIIWAIVRYFVNRGSDKKER